MPLTVREALVASVQRVDSESRGRNGGDDATIFAVFDAEPPTFLGLVTTPTMARFPHRIFADLVVVEPQASITGDVAVEAAVEQLRASGVGALAVHDAAGALLGAVTRESLLGALLGRERQLSEALRVNDLRLRVLFSAMPDHAFVLDPGGRYLSRKAMRLDDSARHVFDGDAGQALEDVLPAPAAALLRGALLDSLRSGALRTVTLRLGDAAHPSIHELRLVPNGADSVLCVARDVTEVNRIKAQLVFADRMVAMGTLAASMAHEINNPLAYISGNVQVLSEEVASLEPVPAALEDAPALLADIQEGVSRIASIVGDLRVFGKGDCSVASAVDVGRVLRSAVNIATPHVRSRARIVTELAEVPAIEAVEARLGQVFVNLLINAGQAIPDGEPARNQIVVRLYAEAGEVHVVVADSGSGLSADARAHLFEAFFTTKTAEPHGTGLGLFISNSIIAALGGRILIEDGILGGCAFHVVLPVTAPRAIPGRPAEAPPAPARRARILAVDDEGAILRVLPTLLQPHEVTTAGNGAAALAMLAEKGPFDVVVCDLMMPGMSGIDVFHAACAGWPELRGRFVFVTGGAYTAAGLDFLEAQPVVVVAKPFEKATLLAAVNRTLHAGDAPSGDALLAR